jgi:hypothetical protein
MFRKVPIRPGLTCGIGASDNGAMTLHVTRLPFSLDPLIAEAKRRMRRRRSLLAVLGLFIIGGAVAGAVLGHSGHSPRGPAVDVWGGVPEPHFRSAPGWQVGSTLTHACVGVTWNVCHQAEAWAATVPYRDCAVCTPPHKTLAALPPNGIVIQLSNVRERRPNGPLGSWPPHLRASQVGGFDGAPSRFGVIQRMWRDRNGVEHFLWIWFGRKHPTTDQLTRASTELRTFYR